MPEIEEQASTEAAGAKARKPRSTGVGPSKRFVAPEGTFEQTHDWSKLTVNGQAIPETLWAQIPYSMTDQGAAELNAGKEVAHAKVVREAPLSSRSTEDLTRFKNEQSIEQSVAQYRESLDLLEQEDPLGVLMKRHLPAGHRGLWLSERKVSDTGYRRGVVDYEPVLDQDGKRIQHGRMFLGSVPEPLASAAEQHYEKRNRELTKSAVETVREHNQRVMTDAGIRRQNQRGDLPDEGIEFLDKEQGGMVPGKYGHTFAE